MKKLLSLLAVFTAVLCFASEAQAGLSFSVSVGDPYCGYGYRDYGYSRRHVTYYDAPRYYRPRRRVVHYSQPVYYSRPRYYRSSYYGSRRHCD